MAEYAVEFEDGVVMVREGENGYEMDLSERFIGFAVDTVKFLSKIPYKREYDVFRYQLSKSATSIGANYEESQASSFAEFRHRISICLKESRETVYWYKVIERVFDNNEDMKKNVSPLLQEAKEISLIIGAISSKIKDK